MNDVDGTAVTRNFSFKSWRTAIHGGIAAAVCIATGVAQAASPASMTAPRSSGVSAEADVRLGIGGWIERMHQASRNRNYSGTFVVFASNGGMSSSRIWHACNGNDQVERVDALSGTPRVVFRHNGEVRTFLSQSRVVRKEQRELLGFPQLPMVDGASIAKYYVAQVVGQERVAGFDADVVWFRPVDAWRFGYRIWAEKASGLVLKLQTLDSSGAVLEQAAFSELTLDASVQIDQIVQMMSKTDGYRVVSLPLTKTTAEAEGWQLREPVSGFVPMTCYHKGDVVDAAHASPLQCIYSDGLATVSVFLEPYNAQSHPSGSRRMGMGATQTLGARIMNDTWVTAVGEVPQRTLQRFVDALERTR